MIKTLDKAFDYSFQKELYNNCRSSPYYIGWEDSSDIELRNRQFFYSPIDYDSELTKKMDFKVRNTSFKEYISNYGLSKVVVNCSRPGETYWSHDHGKNYKVVLYYPNFKWNREWGGETVFYDKKGENLVFASEYKPNRLLLFNGDIPHSVRAPTYIADQYRFTISLFYKEK